MKELFSIYLQAGISGSILIAVILVARLFLRRAPRRILCTIWLLAVLRLLVPFQVESTFSLQPKQLPSFAAFQEESVIGNPDNSLELPTSTPQAGIQENTSVSERLPVGDIFLMVSVLWSIVTCGFLLYGMISYLLFKASVRDAVRQSDGTKECQNLHNAFLIGLFRPEIYLPANLTAKERELIVAHEKTHIAHGDNWWKLLSYLCLCLHWYNPIIWLGFHFFNKDIEIACDEMVVRDLNVEARKAYSMALLNFSKRSYVPYPPSSAFGKVNLKRRLQHILSYKKPGIWISAAAVLLTVVIAVCFLTSPQHDAQTPQMQLQTPNIPVPSEPLQTSAPATEPEPTEPSATEPPVTEPPATEPPATQPPATKPKPTTAKQPESPSWNAGSIDLAALDTNVTEYAAGLGFQTLDSHPNTAVTRFDKYIYPFPKLTYSDLQDAAREQVDRAYRYCINNQYMVSSSVLWVEVSYSDRMGRYAIIVYCAA